MTIFFDTDFGILFLLCMLGRYLSIKFIDGYAMISKNDTRYATRYASAH